VTSLWWHGGCIEKLGSARELFQYLEARQQRNVRWPLSTFDGVLMPYPDKSKSPAEKRKIDEKLDDALEESFPGSEPISISQPAPVEKPPKPRK
jgi:hypothetical protein